MVAVKFRLIFFLVILGLSPSFAQSNKIEIGNLTYLKESDGYYKLANNMKWKVVENQIVVRKKSTVVLSREVLKALSLENIVFDNSFFHSGSMLVTIQNGEDIIEVVKKLIKSNLFDNVEPNLLGGYCTVNPNDTYFSNQWNLGQINMLRAWDITTGSSNITVAILDSGLDTTHPDLVGNLPSSKGKCYARNNLDPSPLFPNDNSKEPYHGTECSGIIAGSTNNGIGVAGIAGGWNTSGVKLYHYNISDGTSGFPNAAYVGAALQDAALNSNIKVISMSIYLADVGGQIHDGIISAYNQGKVIVCAAGNYLKSDWPKEIRSIRYPASEPYVVAVGASTHSNIRKQWDTDPVNDGETEDLLGKLL